MVEKEIQMAVNFLRATSESNYRIALQTGISQPTIAKYRRGESIPGLNNARSIVAYFKSLEQAAETLEPAPIDDLHRLFQALERRDNQLQELLDQQHRLISIIEKLQSASDFQFPASPVASSARPDALCSSTVPSDK